MTTSKTKTRRRATATASAPLPKLVNLLPYQQRWIEDASPLKIAVKARQIGYSFAATLRAVFECVRGKSTWILLSKGERQSRLLMEKVQEHVQSCGLAVRSSESTFFEGTTTRQLEVRFPNGSVIYGLPANPDTARGYSGHVMLDEFAFHADAGKIYTALYPSITRGYGLEIISTPNGQQGKFYELAKTAGLVEAEPGIGDSGFQQPMRSAVSRNLRAELPAWSAHWCDVYEAIRQGLNINVPLLRAGCEDETSWLQEYCCQFVSTAENFIPPDLLTLTLSAEASLDTPLPGLASAPRPAGSEFYLGIDIGRHHDRTVAWLDEMVPAERVNRKRAAAGKGETTNAPVAVARLVRSFTNAPFAEQLEFVRKILSLRGADGEFLVRRAAIDATGMGAPLAESLAREFGPRVEAVVFTAAVKEDLAYRTKRRLEARGSLLPDAGEIRRAFSAVKRLVTTTGNLRFDAERTDAGHADEFWAKALADLAADRRPASGASEGFLLDGEPLISPGAFSETDMHWGELDQW